MHLCNLFNNLRLLLERNDHLSTRTNLAAFFGADTIRLLLFMQVYASFWLSQHFIMNIEVFKVIFFSKNS